jgi:hypothetical protein
MIKTISNEFSGPLAHIFNLSLSQGIFPDKFKIAEIFLYLKQVINWMSIIIGQSVC